MGLLQQWDGSAIEIHQIASLFGDIGCADGLCECGDPPKLSRSTTHPATTMTKPSPRLPDTRIVNIPTDELPGWARELDIDPTGLDEATLRFRLKKECERLFPIVHADFIEAYNEMVRRDGFPLAEWSYI